MLRYFALSLACLFSLAALNAQFDDYEELEDEGGYLFGLKGGLTVGTQNWGGFEREPLLAYHGDLFIESLPEEGKFSLWAQLGYHIRGSSIQNRFGATTTGQVFLAPGESFQFRNAVLGVGARQVFSQRNTSNLYWLFGLRVEYTLDTNLDDYDSIEDIFLRGYFPFEDYNFINRVNYGAIVGGGFEFPLSPMVSALIEISASPDFSLQYNQPEIPNVIDPRTAGNTTLPARQIRNLTLEVSAGFRFRRRIIYID
ncbi:MAG: hypothetical protein AAF433_09520 [Bacteroidota bacterium]